MLDDVERWRFLVHPARKHPRPLLVRSLNVELHEGAGQLFILPRGGGFAGAQADDRVLDPKRLPGPHRQVADDPVALVEQPDHRDPLGHRSHSGGWPGLSARLLLRLPRALLLLGRLLATACRKCQGGSETRNGAHAYSGVQGE